MKDGVRSVLVALPGALAIRLVLTGESFSYLKAGMRVPLLVAGVALVILGALSILQGRRASRPDAAGDSCTDHGGHTGEHAEDDAGHGGHRVAWLLILPLLAVNLIRPAPLGAYAANRETTATTVTGPGRDSILALPAAREGAVELDLREFYLRAAYEDEQLVGTPVRLTGFVVRDPKIPDGYLLTRFAIGCCAADAYPIQVVVHGLHNSPADDTWVEVTGLWRAPAMGVRAKLPTLDADDQRHVDQPERPYL